MINNLIRYLDLQSEKRQQGVMVQGKHSVSLPVIPQYIALVSGIMIQPYLARFQQDQVWKFDHWPGWLFFALVIATTIFPAVYKKAFDPSSNLFVQLCTIFSSGIGWQSLFATAITPSIHTH
jgi:hypothetical protein